MGNKRIEQKGMTMYDCFYPGRVWLDTEGKPIQAHGGSVFVAGDKYYWYGENKEMTDGVNGIWTYGVRMYESTDLYNWRDLGCVIPADEADPASPLHPTAKLDRPHILYNKATGKFVCWVKVMREDGTQRSTVLTAERITGPYTIVRQDFRPLGMNAGDFDLVAAEDGKGYYYFERVHSETICADLTDDYTDVTGYYSTHFPHHNGPPHVREATAHFFRQGKHYLVTSGTTGYYPNPSEVAVGDTWHGPFTVLGEPHVDDHSHTSFHTQISSVLRVPAKKDLYIALADRWKPDCIDLDYPEFLRLMATLFGENVSAEDKAAAKARAGELRLGIDETRKSTYVWLPFTFDGGIPRLHWRDRWKLEDFD